jgi:hypothetical protein
MKIKNKQGTERRRASQQKKLSKLSLSGSSCTVYQLEKNSVGVGV